MGKSVQHTGTAGPERKGQITMAKLFTTLLVQIRKADAALIERGRPPRRGFELAIHPATMRRSEERPSHGARSPRYR